MGDPRPVVHTNAVPEMKKIYLRKGAEKICVPGPGIVSQQLVEWQIGDPAKFGIARPKAIADPQIAVVAATYANANSVGRLHGRPTDRKSGSRAFAMTRGVSDGSAKMADASEAAWVGRS
jgi:hypothetical protein